MKTIVTITLNTAVDYVVELQRLLVGEVLVAERSQVVPAGKGVNVSRTLGSMGYASTMIGFVGTASAPAFRELSSALGKSVFVAVDGSSRMNVSLHETSSGVTTHIRSPGFVVTSDDVRKMLQILPHNVSAGDLVVLSGSLPEGAPVNLYADICEWSRGRGAIVVLDSSGAALAAGLRGRPYLIKPNQRELEEIVGYSLGSDEAVCRAACSLTSFARVVAVSRAADGVLAVDSELRQSIKAFVPAPEIRAPIRSTVGTGDAMVGGFVAGLALNLTFPEVIRLGVACGTAALFSGIPGCLDQNALELWKSKVVLEAVPFGIERTGD